MGSKELFGQGEHIYTKSGPSQIEALESIVML